MSHKKYFYQCTYILLTIAAGLSGAVNAEGFSLDSINKGLNKFSFLNARNPFSDQP